MISLQELPLILKRQREKFRRLRLLRAPDSSRDEALIRLFGDETVSDDLKCHGLVEYLWYHYTQRLDHQGTIAYYPGLPSIYGARNDGIEGVTRLLPLWACYVQYSNSENQQTSEVGKQLLTSLVHGTNPDHPGYWGNIVDKSTLICEGADVALAVWLCRDFIRKSVTPGEWHQICAWLGQIPGKQTSDNNWHLFVVFVDVVLANLGIEHNFKSKERYQRVKDFYVGDGCFKDGESGEIDLYNAWAFHYLFFWIHSIDEEFDPDFITQVISDFASWYQHLFTANGVVLFGRSLCYRMAMPTPLLAASVIDQEKITPDSAMSALMSCFSLFIQNGGIKHGRPSQGVFEENEVWVDPYTGPASSFWGFRPLILYFYLVGQKWLAGSSISRNCSTTHDKVVRLESARMTISVNAAKKRASLEFWDHDKSFDMVSLKKSSTKDRIRAFVLGTTCRPANNLQKLRVKSFDSSLDYYRRRI